MTAFGNWDHTNKSTARCVCICENHASSRERERDELFKLGKPHIRLPFPTLLFIVSLSVIVIVVDVVVVVNVVVVIEASRGSSKNVHYVYSYLIFI